jgi:hypothetical protein
VSVTDRPLNLGELLEDLVERVRRLENRDAVVIGAWVLEEADDGGLIARHAPTDTVVVVAPPV